MEASDKRRLRDAIVQHVFEATGGDRRLFAVIDKISSALNASASDVHEAIDYLVDEGILDRKGMSMVSMSHRGVATRETPDELRVRMGVLRCAYDLAGGSHNTIVDIHDIAARTELGFNDAERILSFLEDEGLLKRAGMNRILLTIEGIRACEDDEERSADAGADAASFDTPNVGPASLSGDDSLRFTEHVRVGTGAQGSVYAAFDTRMARHVALKFLHDDPSETGVLVQARAMAAVMHPNVVTIFQDVLTRHPVSNEIVSALVMELVNGEELGERFGRTISVDEARVLGRGILAGIGAFHERQRFHGDLHTEQVLVDKQGVAKIIDAPRSKSFAALSTASLSRMQEKDCRDVRWLLIEILERVDLLRANAYRKAVNDNPPHLDELRHEFEAALGDEAKETAIAGSSAERPRAATIRADVAGEVLHAALRFATDLGSVVSTQVRSAEDVSDAQDPDAQFRKEVAQRWDSFRETSNAFVGAMELAETYLPQDASDVLTRLWNERAAILAAQKTYFATPNSTSGSFYRTQFFRDGFGAEPEKRLKGLREEARRTLRAIMGLEVP